MSFRIATAAAALALAASSLIATGPAIAGHKHHDACSIIAKFDRDKDGKMNIFEAKRAGKSLFKHLNPDGDFTLEPAEVHTRISEATFNKYNLIKRKGLDKLEWLRLVKHRFKAANPDGDRTIECAELHTKAGKRLLAVIYH